MDLQNERLTILHLLFSMGETSAGYNEHCLALAGKRNITICTFLKPTVTCPPELTLFAGDGSIPGFLRALHNALAERKYDIVHAHDVNVGLLFLVAHLFKAWKSIPPTVFTVHTSYPNYKFRNRLILIPIVIFFQRLVCCSQGSLASLPRFYKWLAKDRLYVVQNGVDINRIDRIIKDEPRYQRNGNFTVVTVGRLIKIKNPLLMLRAFLESADRSSRLVLIGHGNLRDALIAESQACGISKQVELTGLIPRNQVYQKLIQADLFLSASWVEGLPVSVLEAMICRCPVILSDIPPHREIAHGSDFIPLIQPDDIAGFALEIKRFGRMSTAKRAEVGEKCRKLAEKRFSLMAMHKKYDEIYSQML